MDVWKEGGDRSRWVGGGSRNRHTRMGLVNREGKNGWTKEDLELGVELSLQSAS